MNHDHTLPQPVRLEQCSKPESDGRCYNDPVPGLNTDVQVLRLTPDRVLPPTRIPNLSSSQINHISLFPAYAMATMRPDISTPIPDIKVPFPIPTIVETDLDFPLPPSPTSTDAQKQIGGSECCLPRDQPNSVNSEQDQECCIDLPDYDCAQASAPPAKPTPQDSRCLALFDDKQERKDINPDAVTEGKDTLQVPTRFSKKFSFGSEKSQLDVRQLEDETETPEEAVECDEPSEEVTMTDEAPKVDLEKETQVEKREDRMHGKTINIRPEEEDQDKIEPVREKTKDGNKIDVKYLGEVVSADLEEDKKVFQRREDDGEVVTRTGVRRLRSVCRGIRKGARRCWAKLVRKGYGEVTGRW